MPRVCRECKAGVWQCGEEGHLCGPAGDPWIKSGVAYVPVGVGGVAVAVQVYTKIIEIENEDGELEPQALVKLERFCLPGCPPGKGDGGDV